MGDVGDLGAIVAADDSGGVYMLVPEPHGPLGLQEAGVRENGTTDTLSGRRLCRGAEERVKFVS